MYCPGGPDSDFEYSTQSYTGYEPTSMRAIRARYHPYVQARARVDQLRRLGHTVDKVGALTAGREWVGQAWLACVAPAASMQPAQAACISVQTARCISKKAVLVSDRPRVTQRP